MSLGEAEHNGGVVRAVPGTMRTLVLLTIGRETREWRFKVKGVQLLLINFHYCTWP